MRIIKLNGEKNMAGGKKTMRNLEEKIRELPPELQQEVEDFVEFLIEKRLRKPRGKPSFSWAGALKELRDQYTSVELQHKALDWMSGEE